MTKHAFPGLFVLIFLAASFAMAAFYMPGILSRHPVSSFDAIVKGTWAARFEKTFGEDLPVFSPSRSLWGNVEFALFQQGRKGVVVGDKGWLFTDEEFSCPAQAKQHLADNLAFIAKTRDALAKKNVQMAVVLIPAKARINKVHLSGLRIPGCRAGLYDASLAFLQEKSIPTADLARPMLKAKDRDALYLRTDTHWAPQGARLGASLIAERLAPLLKADKKQYASTAEGVTDHHGDLLRYLPGVETVKPDRLAAFATAASDEGNADLFGEAAPSVTLVGTSYSANPLWNFEGFLKESLQADVLNMADEGLGPFTVMDKYLDGKALQDAPPEWLIWEIPERYMIFPHDINAAQ